MPPTLAVTAVVLALLASAMVWFFFRQYRNAESRTGWLVLPDRFTESPSSAVLILASIAGLFLELLLVRWISSEIRIFAYFKNFVLIACFLGFGLGFYLCRRAISLLPLVGLLSFIVLIVQVPLAPLRHFIEALPVLLGSLSEVQIWGVGQAPVTATGMAGLAIATIVVLPLFLLIANVFVPIGQLIGRQLELAEEGIGAYSLNVAGSLAGILLYTAICFASQPPLVWFLVAAVLSAWLFLRTPKHALIVAVVMIGCGAMIAFFPTDAGDTYWSPYQKLTIRPVMSGDELVAYDLQTNHSWYQKIINLSAPFVASHSDLMEGVPIELNAYNIPFHFVPRPTDTLILGAGMGNDVAAAVRNGSQRVVAVEIDPLIVKLGKQLHFEKPYSSPRVHVLIDDARSYLENSDARYDLIVFSLLDSHTTNSQFSNIRIDNYVYTAEAFASARRLLKPDGVMIVKFQVQRDWIAGRLHELLTSTFGFQPLHFQSPRSYTSSGRFFVTGSRERILQALGRDPQFASWIARTADLRMEEAAPTTDDWPYFYQRDRGIPISVAVISVLLLVACALSLGRSGVLQGIDPHFLLLGAGFMMLETQIVSRMALLFGTTWVVNSIVISAILCLILVANVTAKRWPSLSRRSAYVGLVVSMLVGLFIPTHLLLLESVLLRACVAGLLLCLPVFFAGIIFIRSFAEAAFSGKGLGANLLGSVIGGVLESVSLWTGLRSILMIAIALYLASLLARKDILGRQV
jgi:spermidine synthase